jgi:hypothetical protein
MEGHSVFATISVELRCGYAQMTDNTKFVLLGRLPDICRGVYTDLSIASQKMFEWI